MAALFGIVNLIINSKYTRIYLLCIAFAFELLELFGRRKQFVMAAQLQQEVDVGLQRVAGVRLAPGLGQGVQVLFAKQPVLRFEEVPVHQRLGDGQSQPRSAVVAIAGGVGAPAAEQLE